MLDLFGSPQHYSGGSRPVVIDTTIEGGNVDYWYQEAQRLRREYAMLIDVNEVNFRNGIEFRASDAALRAVIRRLIVAIRTIDPDNRLLVKENRDRLFMLQRDVAMKMLLQEKKEKAWALRNAKHAETASVIDSLSN